MKWSETRVANGTYKTCHLKTQPGFHDGVALTFSEPRYHSHCWYTIDVASTCYFSSLLSDFHVRKSKALTRNGPAQDKSSAQSAPYTSAGAERCLMPWLLTQCLSIHQRLSIYRFLADFKVKTNFTSRIQDPGLGRSFASIITLLVRCY